MSKTIALLPPSSGVGGVSANLAQTAAGGAAVQGAARNNLGLRPQVIDTYAALQALTFEQAVGRIFFVVENFGLYLLRGTIPNDDGDWLRLNDPALDYISVAGAGARASARAALGLRGISLTRFETTAQRMLQDAAAFMGSGGAAGASIASSQNDLMAIPWGVSGSAGAAGSWASWGRLIAGLQPAELGAHDPRIFDYGRPFRLGFYLEITNLPQGGNYLDLSLGAPAVSGIADFDGRGLGFRIVPVGGVAHVRLRARANTGGALESGTTAAWPSAIGSSVGRSCALVWDGVSTLEFRIDDTVLLSSTFAGVAGLGSNQWRHVRLVANGTTHASAVGFGLAGVIFTDLSAPW
jgi:hypothetical protein